MANAEGDNINKETKKDKHIVNLFILSTLLPCYAIIPQGRSHQVLLPCA